MIKTKLKFIHNGIANATWGIVFKLESSLKNLMFLFLKAYSKRLGKEDKIVMQVLIHK